jgi:hypothetical protein
MQLRFVTITGADDAVKYEDLKRLHDKHPFVEFAILFSQTKTGPRYPGWDWVLGLMEFNKTANLNLSAHLCGKWVQDVLSGNLTFFNREDVCQNFRRCQLNLGESNLKKALESKEFLDMVKTIPIPIILGGNYKNIKLDFSLFADYGICPLFDASGGKGIEEKAWIPLLEVWEPVLCGYAGGLGPDNLQEQLESLHRVINGREVWIDMETKVRTGDQLDLAKVGRVLEIAREWMAVS